MSKLDKLKCLFLPWELISSMWGHKSIKIKRSWLSHEYILKWLVSKTVLCAYCSGLVKPVFMTSACTLCKPLHTPAWTCTHSHRLARTCTHLHTLPCTLHASPRTWHASARTRHASYTHSHAPCTDSHGCCMHTPAPLRLPGFFCLYAASFHWSFIIAMKYERLCSVICKVDVVK